MNWLSEVIVSSGKAGSETHNIIVVDNPNKPKVERLWLFGRILRITDGLQLALRNGRTSFLF